MNFSNFPNLISGHMKVRIKYINLTPNTTGWFGIWLIIANTPPVASARFARNGMKTSVSGSGALLNKWVHI